MSANAKIYKIVSDRLLALDAYHWNNGLTMHMHWDPDGYEGRAMRIFVAILETDGWEIDVTRQGLSFFDIKITKTEAAYLADVRREEGLPYIRARASAKFIGSMEKSNGDNKT